jgi:hypothetical protein
MLRDRNAPGHVDHMAMRAGLPGPLRAFLGLVGLARVALIVLLAVLRDSSGRIRGAFRRTA